jgi:hypothetical protein
VDQKPTVSRIVHYVSHGSPVRDDGTQEFPSVCRAAIVAEVYPAGPPSLLSGGEIGEGEPQVCALVVLNPTGLFFHDCQQDENNRAGGTWHWPERV